MSCPLCQSSSQLAFEAKGYRILDCNDCGHRFADVQTGESHVTRVYDDSYFQGGGAGYSDYSIEADLLRGRGAMYARKLAKFTENPGRILDVGAAAGYVLQGFIHEGWEGVGLEPNIAMVEEGRDRLGLDLRQGSLEGFETDETFDLISMIQVVAHLYDPRTAFENASALLKDDGLLLIETWNRDSLLARIFGKNWHEYSPPSVLHYFSQGGLRVFLEDMGFQQITSGRPSKKISGEHARSLLRYRLGDSFLLKLIPGKINFPYPSEDLFWALYRKK